MDTVTDADVVVLAQASMVGATDLMSTALPVLASPRLAVEALCRDGATT